VIAEFTIRLVTSDGALLAWTTTQGQSRPQGRPKPTTFVALGPSVFDIEQDGIATHLVIHWHDLDVARMTPIMNPTPVQQGQQVRFDWIEPMWLVKGSDAEVPMPSITVRKRVVLAPPPAAMGVRSYP
jgi:hypothetical protein